jgi:hypothetical protein
MRRAARVDSNQGEIVDALRAVGASVQSLAAIGKGCPDLLVGYNGFTFLIEIKDPSKPKSDIQLTPDQKHWHHHWYGTSVAVVYGIEGALHLIRHGYEIKESK